MEDMVWIGGYVLLFLLFKLSVKNCFEVGFMVSG